MSPRQLKAGIPVSLSGQFQVQGRQALAGLQAGRGEWFYAAYPTLLDTYEGINDLRRTKGLTKKGQTSSDRQIWPDLDAGRGRILDS